MNSEPKPSPSPDPATEALGPVAAAVADGAPPKMDAMTGWGLPWAWIFGVLFAVVSLLSLSLAWKAQQRGASLEQTLVGRQEAIQREAAQSQMLAKQANDKVLEAAAKVALLEARVAEVAVQRGQVEELIQSLSRSRDENVLVDIEAGIRVALQQSAITGSAEPLVAVLKQSDERLSRYNQPRLEGVRRAIARDLDKVKAVSVADVSLLSIKLDEVVRLVDDLPLLSRPEFRQPANSSSKDSRPDGSTKSAAPIDWTSPSGWSEGWGRAVDHVVAEVKSLVRVTRIDHPDAMLLAPEQAFFLRENLKLRLLNARLALLSRQFETAQSDLQLVLLSLDRYFDRQNRRTAAAADVVRGVAAQSRQVVVPRPDNTLAALSAAGSAR
ncbi:MAG: uroporphyrinogen-III C-methyltransferase [Burkholderiaceae bacterium]